MKKPTVAFDTLPVTWPAVCGYAAGIGIYVGVINQIQPLYNTSFRDIAVTPEWWVLFAVLIVSNCKSAWEAGLKCLVFFLISQPLVYLVELPTLGWEKALFYYTRIWLPVSLLTLPGGAVAFFAKKQNMVGAAVLGVGNTVVALVGESYFLQLCRAFPRHLLTVISCIGIVAATVCGMQKNRKTRLLSLAVTALLTAGITVWALLSGRTL